MKKEYKEKALASPCYEREFKIAKELGVDRSTITQWRKEFGLRKWRTYTEAEKLELITKYHKMKNRNPHLAYCKIAAKLNVPQCTIQRWIQEFRNKKERETTKTADFELKDGRYFIFKVQI
uniref:Transposase n=1 Tax=Globodera pallida TaxID=36090 RepID=A0A183CAX4_GLOPA